MTPSWYDVLGVEPDADEATIRAAWRQGIAELDPTDRRFRALNQAAEVLLDPERRAAHDAVLAAEAAEAEQAEQAEEGDRVGDDVPVAAVAPVAPAAPDAVARPGRAPRVVPTWLLLVAAGLAIALTITAAVVAFSGSGTSVVDDAGADQAEQVAVRAIGPVLSYDYRHLDEDAAAAKSYMTPSYQEQYDQTFALVKQNAPRVQAVVSAQVVEAGVVRTGSDRVEVLVFVNRPTTNKQSTTPVVYKDQVTVTMVRDGDTWLIDDLSTGASS